MGSTQLYSRLGSSCPAVEIASACTGMEGLQAVPRAKAKRKTNRANLSANFLFMVPSRNKTYFECEKPVKSAGFVMAPSQT
jgi:hypothetical protein